MFIKLQLPFSFSIQVQSSLKTNPGSHTGLVEPDACIAAITVSCSNCVRIGLNKPPFVLKYSVKENGIYFFTNLVKLVFLVRYRSNSIMSICWEFAFEYIFKAVYPSMYLGVGVFIPACTWARGVCISTCTCAGVWTGCVCGQGVCTPPPPRWPMTQSVRILLECILV